MQHDLLASLRRVPDDERRARRLARPYRRRQSRPRLRPRHRRRLPPAGPPRPASVVPLSPDRYELRVTIGRDTLDRLRRAQDLLRHAIPSGDEAAILDRAFAALLVELERKKLAATETPRPSRGAANGSRHIPAAVKRAVWRRDLGRCAFVGSGGRRCGERAFLELHHVRPYAAGGEATADNIQLRCRRHNQHEARVYFAALGEDAAGGRGRDGVVRAAATGRPAATVMA